MAHPNNNHNNNNNNNENNDNNARLCCPALINTRRAQQTPGETTPQVVWDPPEGKRDWKNHQSARDWLETEKKGGPKGRRDGRVDGTNGWPAQVVEMPT